MEPIYAVMITGKSFDRVPMAKLSIQSFFEQTYTNRHLLIVNDGGFEFDISSGDMITQISVPKKLTLGELRNVALDHLPTGTVWVQWDDDDWHHPSVMSEQYRVLSNADVPCCFMKTQVRYSFNKNCAWIFGRTSNPTYRGICGTGMFRNSDIRYPALRKTEDSVFSKRYEGNDILWDNPSHYYLRFIHGNNTWDDNHFLSSRMKQDTWNIDDVSKTYLKEIIEKYK
jgi:glycosyltransferase involved in cell wall biosynthesis